MTQTYKMRVDACESYPHLVAEFSNIPQSKIARVFHIATDAFRDVEVTAEETGEIIFRHYVDLDWFNPICKYGEVIDAIRHICYDKN